MFELWACGYNGSHQATLDATRADVYTFVKVASGEDIKVVAATWNKVAYSKDGKLFVSGRQLESDATASGTVRNTFSTVTSIDGVKLLCGSESRVISAIDRTESHHTVVERNQYHVENKQYVTHLTANATGKVVAAVRHNFEWLGRLETPYAVIFFKDVDEFLTWYTETTEAEQVNQSPAPASTSTTLPRSQLAVPLAQPQALTRLTPTRGDRSYNFNLVFGSDRSLSRASNTSSPLPSPSFTMDGDEEERDTARYPNTRPGTSELAAYMMGGATLVNETLPSAPSQSSGSFPATNDTPAVEGESPTLRMHLESMRARWPQSPEPRELEKPLKMLISSSTAFAALTTAGKVYTWGDRRYPHVLGRAVGRYENQSYKPCLLPGTEGQFVTKIASCITGQMMGCVTQEGDAYLWGKDKVGGRLLRKTIVEEETGTTPDTNIAILENIDDDFRVARIELPVAEGAEEPSIVDLAIGDGHILVLDENGRVWSAGTNSNGQLGLGCGSRNSVHRELQAVETFEELRKDGKRARRVYCGDLTSYVVVEVGVSE